MKKQFLVALTLVLSLGLTPVASAKFWNPVTIGLTCTTAVVCGILSFGGGNDIIPLQESSFEKSVEALEGTAQGNINGLDILSDINALRYEHVAVGSKEAKRSGSFTFSLDGQTKQLRYDITKVDGQFGPRYQFNLYDNLGVYTSFADEDLFPEGALDAQSVLDQLVDNANSSDQISLPFAKQHPGITWTARGLLTVIFGIGLFKGTLFLKDKVKQRTNP